MGKNLNIYLGDDAVASLEKKKKIDNFNLSGFVATALLKEDKASFGDVEEINKTISQKKVQIQLIEAEIETLFATLKRINFENAQIELDKKQLEEKKVYERNMSEFFSNITDEQRQEMKEGMKSGKWKTSIEYYIFKNNNESYSKPIQSKDL